MTPTYYQQQRTRGEAYEAYLVGRLTASGVLVRRLATREDQLARGDLAYGRESIEVKFDTQLATTGNLFIEVAEKARAEQPDWRPSGIDSPSTAEWYGIGNERRFLLFLRRDLRAFRTAAAPTILTIHRGTSRGFLLPVEQAIALVRQEWRWR